MKSLLERFDELDKKYFRTVTPNGYFNRADIMTEVKAWLEDYRQKVRDEPSTPDVAEWFHQAIDELEALLSSNESKTSK